MVKLFSVLRPLVLASKSPRRQQFLKDLGLDFYLHNELITYVKQYLKKNEKSSVLQAQDFAQNTHVKYNYKNDCASCFTVEQHSEIYNLKAKDASFVVPKTGVLAKEDCEQRPCEHELPEVYVLRSAITKAIETLFCLNLLQEQPPSFTLKSEFPDREQEKLPQVEISDDLNALYVSCNTPYAKTRSFDKNENILSNDMSFLENKANLNRELYVRKLNAHSFQIELDSFASMTEAQNESLKILEGKASTSSEEMFVEQNSFSRFFCGKQKVFEKTSFNVNVYSFKEEYKEQFSNWCEGEAFFQNICKNALFISADTIVAYKNKILGKPKDKEHALEMLLELSGKEHRVLTSACIVDMHGFMYTFTDIAKVHFAPWDRAFLEAYVESGEPMDKAGAYGIQSAGMFLSDKIEGAWDTVAGLPVAKLLELLHVLDALTVR